MVRDGRSCPKLIALGNVPRQVSKGAKGSGGTPPDEKVPGAGIRYGEPGCLAWGEAGFRHSERNGSGVGGGVEGVWGAREPASSSASSWSSQGWTATEWDIFKATAAFSDCDGHRCIQRL